MADFACAYCYRKGQEVSLRCRAQAGKMDFCCYQYFCPDTGKNKLAAPWKDCRLRGKQAAEKK